MRRVLIATCVVVSALTLPAAGVIRHPEDDAVTFDTPNPLVVGLWNNNASAVAIGPNHAITTRHQGGGLNSTITFGGTVYDVVEIHNIGNADLRVVRLAKDGGPANLSEWVNVFDGNDALVQDFVLGGYGRARGSALTTQNGTYGYLWGSGPAASPQWGQNVIDATSQADTGTYLSEVLRADFDPYGVGQPAEAIPRNMTPEADGLSGRAVNGRCAPCRPM